MGIGTTTPSSWLHVNSSGTGETFRTTNPSGNDTYWRMFTGSTEYGRLLHFDGGNGFFVVAPQGPLKLASGNLGTAIPAVYILGGSGSNKGYTGIGDYTSFTPGRRLDIYDPTNPQMRLTYNSGSTIYSDFQTMSTGDLYINPMNSTTPKGVGIGTSTVPATTKVEIDAYVPTSATTANAMTLKSLQTTNVVNNIGLDMDVRGGTGLIKGLNLSLTNSTASSFGLNVDNSCTNPLTGGYGVGASLMATGANEQNIGAYTWGVNGYVQNIGLNVVAGNNTTPATGFNIAVEASGYSADKAYGIYTFGQFGASETYGTYTAARGSNLNYGIYADVYGVGGSSTDYAAWINGKGFITSAWTVSDKNLKKNIVPLINATSILNALEPKSFEFDTTYIPQLNLQSGVHYGLIAQDLQNILPGLVEAAVQPVEYDSAHKNIIHPQGRFKAVNYTELIPFLIQGFKEQQIKIDSQQSQLDSLIAALGGSPISANNSNRNSQKIELSDKQGIILNQNDPNPFSESTVITYSIPFEVKEAKIMFTDTRGTVLRTAKIESRGQGSIEVYASELSSGIYTYTLVCDGKAIESKRMMKTK